MFRADLVLVAIGFAGVEADPVYGAARRRRRGGHGRRPARAAPPACPGVFAAGDCVRGADLIVTAIAEGRAAAAAIHAHLARVAAAPAA